MSSPDSAPAVPRGDEVSLIGALASLLRHRRLVLGVTATLLAVVLGRAFLAARTFTAWASFAPQSAQGQMSSLVGVAAQLGLPVPSGGGPESATFYADLVTSRPVLAGAVMARYHTSSGAERGGPVSREGDLIELLGVPSGSPALRRELAMRRLRGLIFVRNDRETGVVKISVTTTWPEISLQVVERLLELVSQFNVETRQSRAQSERRFAEVRLEQARRELRDSEDRLEQFLGQNRDFRNSARLTFQQDRLQRDLAVRQQVVAALAQAFEQARIAEVRDTPVITVVEQAERPVLADPRGLALKALLALLGGAILGGVIALAKDLLLRSRDAEPDEYAAFVRYRDAAVGELRALVVAAARPLRVVARRSGTHR